MLLRCPYYGILILFTYFLLNRADVIEVIVIDELSSS